MYGQSIRDLFAFLHQQHPDRNIVCPQLFEDFRHLIERFRPHLIDGPDNPNRTFWRSELVDVFLAAYADTKNGTYAVYRSKAYQLEALTRWAERWEDQMLPTVAGQLAEARKLIDAGHTSHSRASSTVVLLTRRGADSLIDGNIGVSQSPGEGMHTHSNQIQRGVASGLEVMADLKDTFVGCWNVNTSRGNGSASPFVVSSRGCHLLTLVDFFNELANDVVNAGLPRFGGDDGEDMGMIRCACFSLLSMSIDVGGQRSTRTRPASPFFPMGACRR
jgi:hypothetical protein